MKNNISIGCIAITASLVSLQANALQNGDALLITQGESDCLYGMGVFPSCSYGTTVVSGSYFAMDTNGNGRFEAQEKIAIAPGEDGGIVIGKVQPATIIGGGCSNPSNIGLIDTPWCFFGNAGAHQTQSIPVTINADGTLNFIGWGVTWNGISNIDLSGYAGWGDTGYATINCSTPACAFGDSFVLDYTAHVKPGDPTGFGGVNYGLHLEGHIGVTQPVANVQIAVSGGLTQECSTTGGSDVVMNATVRIPDDDSVESIEWQVNGQTAGSGEMINPYLTLGSNAVTVTLNTVNGLSDTQTVNVLIRDTIAPVVSAGFMNRLSQMPVTELQRFNFIRIRAAAQDVCDPDPVVEAMIGAPVNNGDSVYIMKYFGNVSMNLSKIDLSVRATDNQNNSSKATATINISN